MPKLTDKLSIVYFAWVRERVGVAQEILDIEPPQKITDILKILSSQSGAHKAAFAEPEKLRFALDLDFVDANTQIGKAKELAIFPPVTGG